MKIFKHIILLFILTFFSCQVEPLGEGLLSSTEKIKKDTELYSLLEKVTSEGENPTENIVCIDFIYPFKVLIYDENLTQIGTQALSSDIQFSDFLGNLPLDQSISISYPISTTLEDGTVFSVNNNSELKIVIDSCSKEDIIAYCNGLFGGCDCSEAICTWKVPYSSGNENKYASGFFESNGDGTLHFTYNNINYTGTWVFLFVDDKLHININLEGNSQVAQDWNIDREIEFNSEDIVIKRENKNIILRKSCQTNTVYEIGDTGPAGGIVFYDKGNYSEGWRYMETVSLDGNSSEWGCAGSLITNANNSEIGSGLLNSVLITNYHDNLINYYTNPSVCNSLNNGSVASSQTLLFELNNTKDWFLPSENELSLMYENLKTENLGSFSNSIYWSSTQVDENNSTAIDFSTGIIISQSKISNGNVRAIRYF
jgi:hypothetical protein